MACCRPFNIKNPNERLRKIFPTIQVPCGWCLNCRIDKRNFIEDSAKAYHRKMNGIGAFVLLTYNNFTNLENMVKCPDGKIRYTICYKDFQDFMKRFRKFCDDHNTWNDTTCRKDFKYTVCCEYGHCSRDGLDRNHFHVLFYGIDNNACKKIIQQCWNKGFVSVRPIKAGAIRYVLKYMDKQVCGKTAKKMYDDRGLERPRHYSSVGLSRALIEENLENIHTKGLYDNGSHKLKPLNAYYRQKLRAKPKVNITRELQVNECIRSKVIPDTNVIYDNSLDNVRFNGYSLKQLNERRHQLAMQREYNTIRKLRVQDKIQVEDTFSDLQNANDELEKRCMPFNDWDYLTSSIAYGIPIEDLKKSDVVPF